MHVRTDLAHEIASRPESGLTLEEAVIGSVKITRVVIDRQSSEKTGKPAGNYVTMFCRERDAGTETGALAHILGEMLSNAGISAKDSVLVTGLGNDNVTPDSLGVRSAGKILPTAHFSPSDSEELGLRKVYVIQPGVMAQTGLESAEQLKFICDNIRPDCLIAIDSLACGESQRLAKTVQVTDAGISPGSGVKNQRKELSKAVFGVPVIAIGVPTVIDWKKAHPESQTETLMLVPRDVDSVVRHFSRVISTAANRVLNPGLDDSEIEKLLM